jgi:hypothetical protein
VSERNLNPNFMDELIHCTVHQDEYDRNLTIEQQSFVDSYRDFEFYAGGLQNGKPFDKVAEAKRLIVAYSKYIKDNGGKETNGECAIITQLMEIFGRMDAKDFRELHLEKLL